MFATAREARTCLASFSSRLSPEVDFIACFRPFFKTTQRSLEESRKQDSSQPAWRGTRTLAHSQSTETGSNALCVGQCIIVVLRIAYRLTLFVGGCINDCCCNFLPTIQRLDYGSLASSLSLPVYVRIVFTKRSSWWNFSHHTHC